METLKHWLDYLSLAIAALSGWLPTIAILLSIIWTALRIYESVTVQGWAKKDRRKTQKPYSHKSLDAAKARLKEITEPKGD